MSIKNQFKIDPALYQEHKPWITLTISRLFPLPIEVEALVCGEDEREMEWIKLVWYGIFEPVVMEALVSIQTGLYNADRLITSRMADGERLQDIVKDFCECEPAGEENIPQEGASGSIE